jgi:hypothetical protein
MRLYKVMLKVGSDADFYSLCFRSVSLTRQVLMLHLSPYLVTWDKIAVLFPNRIKIRLKRWLTALVLQPGVECIAQAVTEQVESQHREHDGKAGVEDQVWSGKDLVALCTEHGTPLRRWRLRA